MLTQNGLNKIFSDFELNSKRLIRIFFISKQRLIRNEILF